MKTYECKNCGKESKATKQKVNKYCSNKCQREFEYKKRVHDWVHGVKSWTSREVPLWPRRYRLQYQKGLCQRCECKYDQVGRPLTMEFNHIDGNWRNNDFDNCEMICVQCHSLTHTYRAKDRTKVTEEQKKQEAEHLLKLLRQRKEEPLPEPTLH